MMTHCLRPILLGGVLLLATACASEDYSTWTSHPTHFASGHHMNFSARTVGATRVRVSPDDVAAAQKEQWWGRGVTGMLAGEGTGTGTGDAVAPAAIAGFWHGGWVGKGISSERDGPLQAEFLINPDGYGSGHLSLRDSGAVQGIPWSLRQAGSMGVLVLVKVEGNTVMMSEARKPGAFDPRFTAQFTAEGDRMVGGFGRVTGEFRYEISPVRMTLVRQP
jgi:hypothetical protein